MEKPGGQNLQRALWSSTIQGVFPGHVVPLQGSWHLYLIQACPLGQPRSLKQIEADGLQPVVQMQTALWSSTWHSFPAGQIAPLPHGFLQRPLEQAWLDGHSLWTRHSTWWSGQVSSPCWLMTRLNLQGP